MVEGLPDLEVGAGLPKLDVCDSLSAVGGCNQSSSLPTFVMDMPSSEIPAVGGCLEPNLPDLLVLEDIIVAHATTVGCTQCSRK